MCIFCVLVRIFFATELIIINKCYRLAGQDFHFPWPIPELEAFEKLDPKQSLSVSKSMFINESSDTFSIPAPEAVSIQTTGWVANAQRQVEIWSAQPGILLRVEAGSDIYISPGGQEILLEGEPQSDGIVNETDRQILLGPALVLALAMRGRWCLHASAAIFNDNLLVFLGESGQGKSTLAAELAAADYTNWRRAADDILPVSLTPDGMAAWPHFPQLKLPMETQPAVELPEQLSISNVCVLSDAGQDENPGLQRLSASQVVQVFLSHTAGTRMFAPDLLAKHLAFSTLAAERAAVYSLTYPHRMDAIPTIKSLLEKLC